MRRDVGRAVVLLPFGHALLTRAVDTPMMNAELLLSFFAASRTSREYRHFRVFDTAAGELQRLSEAGQEIPWCESSRRAGRPGFHARAVVEIAGDVDRTSLSLRRRRGDFEFSGEASGSSRGGRMQFGFERCCSWLRSTSSCRLRCLHESSSAGSGRRRRGGTRAVLRSPISSRTGGAIRTESASYVPWPSNPRRYGGSGRAGTRCGDVRVL